MMRKRQENGITLIALVITIIVLLILAGISIAMLTGQNGILNRASEAQEKTGTAQTEELVKLSVTDALTQGLGSLTDVNLKTGLNNNIVEGKYEISGDATSAGRGENIIYETFFVDRSFAYILEDPYQNILFSGVVNTI